MNTQTQKKRTENGHYRVIPVEAITPSPTNPRRSFDSEKLAQLAASIKEQGVLQPILVRLNPNKNSKGKDYEIIAGERRFRAAKLAKRAEIPARVVEMSDEQVLQVQIIENLQREEVHPLDEAEGFVHLKERSGYSIPEIAQHVAKDERFIARRMALVNLIDEAKEDYRQEHITISHALELCRLSPELQPSALAACYEYTNVYDKEAGAWLRRPDKERPARHVRYLQQWVEENVHLNLAKAPFKTDDTRLREDGLTCIDCPQRSGFNKGLFGDIRNDSTCLNPACFKAKLETFVQIKRTEIEAKRGTPPPYISTRYGGTDAERNIIGSYEYVVIERRGTRCEYAEQAIYADGEEVGRVKWICREAKCKDHMNRVPDTHSRTVRRSSSGAKAGRDATDEERRSLRKQELFNIKVDEAVRKRVFAEAIKTYTWPLERESLNKVVCEFFRRIPTDDQKTITEVYGIDKDLADTFRHNPDGLLQIVAKMDETEIARFLMLCSFAHYGANQYMHRQYDQSRVTELAGERGVNHLLIDAEVRYELAPKKYKARHQKYLDEIRGGKKEVIKPVVFERPEQQQQTARDTTLKNAA